MSGGYFMRVSNGSAASVGGITAGNQGLFPDGAYTMQLAGTSLRGPNSDGPSGSVAGQKAKIIVAAVVSPTSQGNPAWTTFTPTTAVTVEVGHIDNDGYMTVYFSS